MKGSASVETMMQLALRCAGALRSAVRSVRDALQPTRHVAKDSALFVGQLVGTQLGDPRDAFQVEERPRRQPALWIPQLGSHLSLPHKCALEQANRHAVLREPNRPVKPPVRRDQRYAGGMSFG